MMFVFTIGSETLVTCDISYTKTYLVVFNTIVLKPIEINSQSNTI